MHDNRDNKWAALGKNGSNGINNNLNNLTVKEIEFTEANNDHIFKPKTIKPALPTKIYHHGYYNRQVRNRKMLPELKVKTAENQSTKFECNERDFKQKNFARSTLKSVRNSQILNSLIQILKTGPDSTTNSSKTRIKTEPMILNQFLESREISSVKNSRGPKIIQNEIMKMSSYNKRKLVSEQKSRGRALNFQDSHSTSKASVIKVGRLDQMQMTFYKPLRPNASQSRHEHDKQQDQNQFIEQQ